MNAIGEVFMDLGGGEIPCMEVLIIVVKVNEISPLPRSINDPPIAFKSF